MDNLFSCRHCGHTGEADTSIEAELVDSMYDRAPTLEKFEVARCAECRSEDLDEAFYCEVCNIRPSTIEGTGLCAVCYQAEEAEQDATVARIKEIQHQLEEYA